MGHSANVRSLDSVRSFAVAVVKFQDEARQSVTALEMQLQRILGWLERDRPAFWKREIEKCYRDISEARVRLHQCQMRKHGTFKPTCHEEKKDLDRAKKALEYSQKQVPVIRYWNVTAQQEANEYYGRSSQLTQVIERDIPEILALLHHTINRLEAYAEVASPQAESTVGQASAAPPNEQQSELDGDATESDEQNDSSLSSVPTAQEHKGETDDEER